MTRVTRIKRDLRYHLNHHRKWQPKAISKANLKKGRLEANTKKRTGHCRGACSDARYLMSWQVQGVLINGCRNRQTRIRTRSDQSGDSLSPYFCTAGADLTCQSLLHFVQTTCLSWIKRSSNANCNTVCAIANEPFANWLPDSRARAVTAIFPAAQKSHCINRV